MKTMKILSVLAMIFSFTQCGTIKYDKNPPFSISSSAYSNWVGGQPGIRGVKVEIGLKEKTDVVFDSLFFNNMKTKLEKTQVNGESFLIGHFNTSSKQDIILDADSTKELKNKTIIETKFPFDLETNEAVISYKVENKTHYYRLESLKEVKQKVNRNN